MRQTATLQLCLTMRWTLAPHLPGSLQVPKVDVRNEEDGLRVQVHHGFQQHAIGPLNGQIRPCATIFT